MSTLTVSRRDSAVDARVTLALFPSLGTTTRMWDPLLAELRTPREELDIVLFDLPGHGQAPSSAGFDMAALVTDAAAQLLGVPSSGPIVVAGVSMGGAIALELARRFPRDIAGLASFNSGLRFGTPAGWQEIIDSAYRAGTPAFDPPATTEGWFSQDYALGPGAETVAALLGDLATADLDGYAACCRALAHYDGRSATGEVKAFGFAVGATEDAATPKEGMLAVAEAGARIRYVELPGAHLAIVEHPAAGARLIDELVVEVRAAGRSSV